MATTCVTTAQESILGWTELTEWIVRTFEDYGLLSIYMYIYILEVGDITGISRYAGHPIWYTDALVKNQDVRNLLFSFNT